MDDKRIYLDHNATTPLSAQAAELMHGLCRSDFGNPSSTHWAGAGAARGGPLPPHRRRRQAHPVLGAAAAAGGARLPSALSPLAERVAAGSGLAPVSASVCRRPDVDFRTNRFSSVVIGVSGSTSPPSPPGAPGGRAAAGAGVDTPCSCLDGDVSTDSRAEVLRAGVVLAAAAGRSVPSRPSTEPPPSRSSTPAGPASAMGWASGCPPFKVGGVGPRKHPSAGVRVCSLVVYYTHEAEAVEYTGCSKLLRS